jgi:TolB-like protein/Tfp pilus assembly protein PilF
MGRFFEELKRRNVFRVAIAYIVVVWLVLQVADVVLPTFRTPEWVMPAFTFLLALGFPIALIFAWAFELTPEGIRPEKEVDRSESITHVTGRKFDFVIIGVLILAVAFLAYDKFVIEPAHEASPGTADITDDEVVGTDTPELSVAVLPFVNMSAEPEQEYFSDGISEELLNQLTKIRGLQVAGRTSSFAFKGKNEDLRSIADQLNVAHILEGSVRKAGNRVRITAQLVKASDGYHLWSETYDRELTDIFGIQEETAKAVASALSVTLGVGEGDLGLGGTRNFEAYDAYLAGVSLMRTPYAESMPEAIDYLEKAVAIDPEYARAWSALASVYQFAANFLIDDRTEELLEKSDMAANRAIEIAPEAVASLQAAARLHERYRDWIRAEQSLTKALELAPADYWLNMYHGWFLESVGRPGEAIGAFRKAARTEPLLLQPVTNLMIAHQYLGDYAGAQRELQRARGMTGNQAITNAFGLVLGMEMGDRPGMERNLAELVKNDPTPPEAWPLTTTMQALLDSPEEALQELRRFSNDPAYQLPLVRNAISIWASYFGDHEMALRIIRDLYAAGQFVTYATWRPIHEEMRRLPGFKDLVRDLGLVDYWRATGNWGEFCRPQGHADFECG